MRPPAITIRLEVEGTPRVVFDAMNESEAARVLEWLDSKPDYDELVGRALELELREQAT